MEKFCPSCQTTKAITEFYSNGNYKGNKKYKPTCRTCEMEFERQRKIKYIREAYGKPLACETCGYNKNIAALEWHHKDPAEKEFSISDNARSLESIKKEISKCICLCANCHRELHNQDYFI